MGNCLHLINNSVRGCFALKHVGLHRLRPISHEHLKAQWQEVPKKEPEVEQAYEAPAEFEAERWRDELSRRKLL